MPNPALEPAVPSGIEAATLQGDDRVGHKNPEDSETPPAAVAPWNPDQTLERLGGDEELLHEVMEIFLEEVPKHLAGLRKAITQQDAETVERIAHSLQGELGYLGIAELLHGACELEERGRTSNFQDALTLLPPFEACHGSIAQFHGPEGRLVPGSPNVSP
jgi:HPt (histidine-containing phosphotransfer) domain-containing protein